jgi:hypothetical protein
MELTARRKELDCDEIFECTKRRSRFTNLELTERTERIKFKKKVFFRLTLQPNLMQNIITKTCLKKSKLFLSLPLEKTHKGRNGFFICAFGYLIMHGKLLASHILHNDIFLTL